MTLRCRMLGLVLTTSLGAYGCQYDHDTVLPGYYAQEGAKATTAPPSSSSQQSQASTASSSQSAAGSGSVSQTGAGQQTQQSSMTGTGATSGSMSATGSQTSGASQTTGSAQNDTGSQSSGNAAAMGAAGTDTSVSGEADPTMAATMAANGEPPGECDVSGRWLVTSHLTTDALGALQYGHYFEYFEIEQHGDAFSVTKGFMCGVDAVGDGTLSANVDFSGARMALPSRVRYDGRKGTATKAADGCQIELENWYTVRGATIPFYLDPNNKLPTADQPATDTTPGWEDWDNDGNPGITGVLTGVVSGKIFVAPRVWTSMSGSVADTSAFTLAVVWGQEQNIVGFDGSALLGTEAAIGPDPKSHFTQFYRLAPDQATGDELAICDAVISLAPQLTPEAAAL